MITIGLHIKGIGKEGKTQLSCIFNLFLRCRAISVSSTGWTTFKMEQTGANFVLPPQHVSADWNFQALKSALEL